MAQSLNFEFAGISELSVTRRCLICGSSMSIVRQCQSSLAYGSQPARDTGRLSDHWRSAINITRLLNASIIAVSNAGSCALHSSSRLTRSAIVSQTRRQRRVLRGTHHVIGATVPDSGSLGFAGAASRSAASTTAGIRIPPRWC